MALNLKLHIAINTFGILFEMPVCGKIELGSYWVHFLSGGYVWMVVNVFYQPLECSRQHGPAL